MIRLGVVGYGRRIEYVIRDSFRGIDPDLRVTGIVDPDEKGVKERLDDCDKRDVIFYETLDAMVRSGKVDALVIATRCNLHTPYAVQASKYDLPLFLEKPVSTSMKQAVALERAYQKAKCPVVVSFPLRVTPLCVQANKRLREGCVGDPVHIAAVNYVPYGTCYWEQGYRYYNVTQGLFLQKATHDFDYMSMLMDSPIVRVAAMATHNRVFGGKRKWGLTCSKCRSAETCLESPQNRRRNGSGGGLKDHPCVFSNEPGTVPPHVNEDCSSALLEFESGAHGVYTQVFFARGEAGTRGPTVSGYHGTLKFDWLTNELRCIRHHEPFDAVEKASAAVGEHSGGDFELARDFIRVVKGKQRSRTTIWDGIRSVYACLAAKQSSHTGRFVNVRRLGRA